MISLSSLWIKDAIYHRRHIPDSHRVRLAVIPITFCFLEYSPTLRPPKQFIVIYHLIRSQSSEMWKLFDGTPVSCSE